MLGGCIYSLNTPLNISNCQFLDNFGINGGVFYALNTPNFTISNSMFLDNMAYQSGGVFYVIDSQGESNQAYFRNQSIILS